ncbi:MAG: translocation/assembly module TamB [Paludibacteraceae bacterium]|nr:translocation/assembly module TamB [Paludibacteraceae bacterium]
MKRFLYIVSVIIVSLVLVLAMLLSVLASDRVKTAAVQLATNELAHALGTEAHVGAIEYRFPARLAIRDLYIEDRQQDTMLYVGEVYAHFSPLALRRNAIRFSHVRVSDGVVNVYRLPDSTYNYQFLVDAFRVEKQDDSPLRSLVTVQDVQLKNLRLRYDNMQVYLPHTAMDLHCLSADLFDAEIGDLALRLSVLDSKQKPLEVESLRAHMILNDTLLSIPTLTGKLPHSRLDLSGIEIHFPAGDTLNLSQSAHDILFSLRLHEALLVPSDIALLVPRLAHMNRRLVMTGQIGGSLDSLYCQDLSLNYNGRNLFVGNVTALGMPDWDNTYLRANFQDVHINAPILQDFLSRLYNRPFKLAAPIHRLGDIHYRGLAEGQLHDLTLHGAFRTGIGTVSTDGTFRSDSLFEHMNYNARVVGHRLRLGRLLATQKLGTATIDVRSHGTIADGEVRGDVKADIRRFTYNDYTYQDLQINGHYEPQRFTGHCHIDDPHLSMAFDGVVDMHDKNPEANFNLLCRHFDSSPLGIKAIGDKLSTRFNLAVDLTGDTPDEMSGYLAIDSLFVGTARDSILMQQLTLLVSADELQGKAFTLRSDFLSAQADGVFRYGDLVPAAQALIHHYLPSLVPPPAQTFDAVQISMRADGQRLRGIQRLFVAPVVLSDHPTMRATIEVPRHGEPYVDMRFFAPGVRAGNTPVHDLTVTLNTIDTLRHNGGKGSGLALSVSAEAMKMQTVFSNLAFCDTVLTHLSLRQESDLDEQLPEGWRDLSPRELQHALSHLNNRERQHALLTAQRAGTYGGDIKMITHFDRYNKQPWMEFHMMPSSLLLRDSVYTIGESRTTYIAADSMVTIDHFLFEGGGQHLMAHGIASPSALDTLEVDLRNIDAAYVVPFVLPVQTIMFNGLLTGKAAISNAFRQPAIDALVHVDSMGLNDCWFGDAEVDLHIFPERRQQDTVLPPQLQFHADVERPTRHLVGLDGEAIFDGSGQWKLDMQADSVPLAFVNHWTASVLSDLDGNATGHVVVGGRKGLTYVLLNAAAQNASFTLPWTGARYTIPEDTIVMDTTGILFPNVHLRDAEGNALEVNGGVYHDQFRDFRLDLHVDVHNALAFDVPDKEGEMLQGKVYASGHVDVTGSETDILVNADAVTANKSRFRLSLDNASSAIESNFIHFIEHPKNESDTVIENDLDNIDILFTTVDSTRYRRVGRCLLSLNLEVNPHLLFQLVLGVRNGDMIQARGSGALQLSYNTETGDVRLLGTYDIEKGTLSYTVGNVIRREFTIGEGSTIAFSGNPTNPTLDVTAKYRVTANLKDLFGDEIDQLSISRTNIPVLTCMHLSGALNNPILSFSLEFPSSDQSIQQQVRQVINTDEMMMRQVIYLLVFGRFFTPDYMSNAQYSTLNSTYSLLSSTVTGQINAWLSKLTNVLTLGVAIRTDGEGASASQEYEAQFQLQPVDRLIINGNVGYRYNDVSNQPFFGDLDVEVLLTEDGQWRLKGYTHTVDKYSLRQASTIQGVGLMWKKDFNWPTKEQLRAKREERKQKKAEKAKEK